MSVVINSLPRACIIGAGSSGIPVVKSFYHKGIPFDCYERSNRVGGNWVFKNKNGMSSAYRSLHINTSRDRMQYADYPMPRSYPDFPHHSLIAEYFDRYVDHFAVRHKIRFETAVESATLRDDRLWLITLHSGEQQLYDALVVANGHHWDPQWPTPPFAGTFSGIEMHSHHYIDPDEPHSMRNKRIAVVGMGNSAMDLACELSSDTLGNKVFLVARRGAHIIPHYINGKPLDQATQLPSWIPFRAKQYLGARWIQRLTGRAEDFGLPRPDHRLGEAHPTISSMILPKLGRGEVLPKPNIALLDGSEVEFVDGSREAIDIIVYCTGYKVSFPFFSESFIAAPNNDLPLWHRMMKPGIRNLFFVGLMQPLGAIMPIAEAQAKWIADYLAGECLLPDDAVMQTEMERERKAMFTRYVASRRHTMQVDFDDFMQRIARSHQHGKARARQAADGPPIEARAQQKSQQSASA